jgi:hypothetical protein
LAESTTAGLAIVAGVAAGGRTGIGGGLGAPPKREPIIYLLLRWFAPYYNKNLLSAIPFLNLGFFLVGCDKLLGDGLGYINSLGERLIMGGGQHCSFLFF